MRKRRKRNLQTKCIFTEQLSSGGTSSTVFLKKIEITAPPNKTSYLSGEFFDPEGMIVEASYNIGSIEVAKTPITGYVVTPAPLVDGTTEATITYSESGMTCSTTQSITVKRALSTVEITTPPTKISYEYSDSFDNTDMIITANYTDNTSAVITAYEYEPKILTNIGTQSITISYTEDGITKTTSFNITVERKSIPKPTWKNNLTYNTASQNINDASLWNNYNTTYMTIEGATFATNAGTYTATFVLKNQYRWNDGSIDSYNADWVINKATGSLSVSSDTLTVTGSNLTVSTNITRLGTGVISYSPLSIAGLTISLNGDTLTITGDGSTAIPVTEVTISVAEDDNYTAAEDQKITVSAVYWEWGSETSEGDAAWWSNLKSWTQKATPEERKACEGKTKKVRLSTAVQGTNIVTMQCIGADQDGDKTLTFQTKGALPNNTTFGSSAVWTSSTARSLCQNFYNYCAAKNSIKTVRKGTCSSYNNDRNAPVTYNNETVFLPSEREMGLNAVSPISVANSTTTKAECTYGYNEPYHYYTSNSERIKYYMDANGNLTSNTVWYWERSRYYHSSDSGFVCVVGTNGFAYYGGYSGSHGLAPAYVIG